VAANATRVHPARMTQNILITGRPLPLFVLPKIVDVFGVTAYTESPALAARSALDCSTVIARAVLGGSTTTTSSTLPVSSAQCPDAVVRR
jgi:hypothetical protein